MDYEKKYKEALDRARIYRDNAKAVEEYSAVARYENIFPELRESEDERIRKKCIELIKRVIPSGDSQSQESKEILDCIAYLEKQKEPTTEELYAEAGTTEKEYIANTMKMVRAMREKKQEQKPAVSREEILHQLLQNGSITLSDYLYLTERQKPADWSKEDKDYYDTIVRKLEIIGDDCGLSNNQIKFLREHYPSYHSEWSEEDEKMLVHVVELLELNCDFSEINNEISWLKSLSCKKIWNKEDERILKGIVGLIGHNQHYDVSNKDMLNWLKSLRPSWKPSEEQMEALRYVAYEHGNSSLSPYSIANKTLASLYEQLKKL